MNAGSLPLHGLELLCLTQMVDPVSSASAVILELRLPDLDIIHRSRRHDDSVFALRVRDEER